MELILHFVGCDSWGRPLYETADGVLFVDIEPITSRPLCLTTKQNNEFDGEPCDPIECTKYKNHKIIIDKRITWY